MADKRLLETILTDQKEDLAARKEENLCRRAEEALIDLNSTQAQVVIGVRRSGKSTLCYQALTRAQKNFAYVNFDDERLQEISSADLNDLLEVLYKINGDFNYLFLDEIQNVDGWHLFVNRLLRKRLHIVITGSNARLLSTELATHLSGRNNEIHLFPFSFAEYCEMKGVDTVSPSTKAIAARRKAFDDYSLQGGFPEMFTISDSRAYVNTLVNNILQRDVVQRYKIQYKAAFEQMAQHLLNNVPCKVVEKRLAEEFHFKSAHTASNYVDYLCQAFLLIRLNKYSRKSHLRLTSQKVYPIDVALMNNRDNAFKGRNLGWRLESVVFLQLLRESLLLNFDIYYYDGRSFECDFIVCKGEKAFLAIQVAYDISNPKTKKRELDGLVSAMHDTHCTHLLLLTDHEYEDLTYRDAKIHIRPVYEWTLNHSISEKFEE